MVNVIQTQTNSRCMVNCYMCKVSIFTELNKKLSLSKNKCCFSLHIMTTLQDPLLTEVNRHFNYQIFPLFMENMSTMRNRKYWKTRFNQFFLDLKG